MDKQAWAERLLDVPDGHPYRKFDGAHWRLVELADLGIPLDRERLRPVVDRVLDWLIADRGARVTAVRPPQLPRLHGSMPGNAVYSCTTLGFGDDARVTRLVEIILDCQWPDGGWNCDRHTEAHRSSFHETVTPAIGLATWARAFDRDDALAAATRAAELLLEHRLFRVGGTGPVIHPSWVDLHYPPYWHYDLLQGLRLLHLVGRLDDERAWDALDLLASLRTRTGGYPSRSWAASKYPNAVDYGRGAANAMLNERADGLLAAAGRPFDELRDRG